MSLSGILGSIQAVFTAIGKALGLIEDEKLRQAGRNEAGIQQLKEGAKAREQMEAVKPTSERDAIDRLRRHDI